MSKLSPIERNLLVALSRSERGLNAYSLFSRFKCSPGELFQAINRLARRELLETQESQVSLTKKGYEWIITNGKYLMLSGEKKWREVPDEFRRPKLRPRERFIPRTTRVHRSLLPPGWKSSIN